MPHKESWATRQLPPVTVAEIERHLDLVASLMDQAGRDAHLFLPIWRRLKLELAKQKEIDAIYAEVKERAARRKKRLKGRRPSPGDGTADGDANADRKAGGQAAGEVKKNDGKP